MNEVIHVVGPAIDEGGLRPNLEIEAVDGAPLKPGYYLVLWVHGPGRSRRGGKRYFGPFATVAEARLLQRSAVALDLDTDMGTRRSVAQCRSIARPFVPTNGRWHTPGIDPAAPTALAFGA